MSIITINGSGHNSAITLYKIHQGQGSFRQDTSTTHSQVKLVQEKLTQLGYNTLGASGIFDANTLSAVKNFQKANGLTQDGYFGKNSLKKLETLLGGAHISVDCTVEGTIVRDGVTEGTPVDTGDYRYGKVNVSTVNIRGSASTGGEYKGRWPKNRIGIVKSYNSSWYQTFWKGNVAYVMKQYIDDAGAASSDYPTRMRKIAANEIGQTKPEYYYAPAGSKWCQYFVNWLAKHAGVASSKVPNTASTPEAIQWFITHGNHFWFVNATHKAKMREYGSVASYTVAGLTAEELAFRPQTGDFVFFRTNTADHCTHVGFVDTYTSSSGMIHTIEGNKGSKVDTRDIAYNNSIIVGYGRIDY